MNVTKQQFNSNPRAKLLRDISLDITRNLDALLHQDVDKEQAYASIESLSGQLKLSKSFRTEQEARDFLALQVEQKSSEIGTLKYEYPEWERGLPPMPAPPEQV